MSVGDWSTATLCTYGDVRNRYSRAGQLTGQSSTDNQNTAITAKIALVKVEIGKRLDGDLRRLYDYNAYDVDDLRDLISNPEVFMESSVARTLSRFFEDNTIDPDDYNFRQMKFYEKEYNDFYNAAMQLIRIDIDESGTIESDEEGKPFGRYRLDRI